MSVDYETLIIIDMQPFFDTAEVVLPGGLEEVKQAISHDKPIIIADLASDRVL